MKHTKDNTQQIIFTNSAKCLDCNRCVRICPVKAIKIKNSQANVDGEKCIVCGYCVNECPQSAKSYRNDIFAIKEILKSNKKTAAIVGPSYASLMETWQAVRLPSILRSIGFNFVAEAAAFASAVAKATVDYWKTKSSPVVTTSCPAVVNYIEKYIPEFIDNLAIVKSPMIATAEYLRRKLGREWSIIFIGPCIAKKYEANRVGYRNLIDAVLTIEELFALFDEYNIDYAHFEESSFDLTASTDERLFPSINGFFKAAGLDLNLWSNDIISTCGFDDLKRAIQYSLKTKDHILIESMVCAHGCINGPGINSKINIYERKANLIEFYSKLYSENNVDNENVINLQTFFNKNSVIRQPKFTEDEILSVLEKINKSNPDDRLDCTSCGYDTCRDKAIAILSGMAEQEMCVSYIRKRSETKADKILQQSPNGIVIVDETFNIASMNQAFRKMFMCSNSNIGKPISKIIDPEPFIKFNVEESEKFEMTQKYDQYNMICHQIIFSLKEEKKLVGVFINITSIISNKEKIDSLKRETILKATELLDHQIIMAQRIAKLLGDSAAQSEELINNLLELTNN